VPAVHLDHRRRTVVQQQSSRRGRSACRAGPGVRRRRCPRTPPVAQAVEAGAEQGAWNACGGGGCGPTSTRDVSTLANKGRPEADSGCGATLMAGPPPCRRAIRRVTLAVQPAHGVLEGPISGRALIPLVLTSSATRVGSGGVDRAVLAGIAMARIAASGRRTGRPGRPRRPQVHGGSARRSPRGRVPTTAGWWCNGRVRSGGSDRFSGYRTRRRAVRRCPGRAEWERAERARSASGRAERCAAGRSGRRAWGRPGRAAPAVGITTGRPRPGAAGHHLAATLLFR